MDLFDRFVPNPKVLVVLRFDMIDVDFFSSIERNLLRVNRLRICLLYTSDAADE